MMWVKTKAENCVRHETLISDDGLRVLGAAYMFNKEHAYGYTDSGRVGSCRNMADAKAAVEKQAEKDKKGR